MNLVRLDQGQRFKEFVECPKAPGENDEAVAVFDKHHLADKEVFELKGNRQERIQTFLVGYFDVPPNRAAPNFKSATVGGLQDSRTPPVDHMASPAPHHPAIFL